MNSESKIPFIIGAIGLLLLVPSILHFLDLFFSLTSIIQAISIYATGDPKVMAGAISGIIIQQIIELIVLIPGIVLCTVAVFKYGLTAKWFRNMLSVYSILMVLTLPLITLVGIYIFILSRKVRV